MCANGVLTDKNVRKTKKKSLLENVPYCVWMAANQFINIFSKKKRQKLLFENVPYCVWMDGNRER